MSHPLTPIKTVVIESFHRPIKRDLIELNKHKSNMEMHALRLTLQTNELIQNL